MIILFHRKVHGASVCLSNKLFLENFNSSDVLRYTKRRKISPLGRKYSIFIFNKFITNQKYNVSSFFRWVWGTGGL